MTDRDVETAVAELTPEEYRLGMMLYSIERTGDHKAMPPLYGRLGLAPIYALLARNLLRNEENRQAAIGLLHAKGRAQ